MTYPDDTPPPLRTAPSTPSQGSAADELDRGWARVDAAAAALTAAEREHADALTAYRTMHAEARHLWTEPQLAATGALPPPRRVTGPERSGMVAVAALADLGITSSRGPGWARQDITDALADTGCPTPPDGPAANQILDIAGDRLSAGIAAAMPDGLRLVDDIVWGSPGTDADTLAEEAMTWRDQAGVAEIVAGTGLWRPPDPSIMPTVRIEARTDTLTATGRRIGELAPRGQAQYWSVYGVLPDGQLDFAADFSTETAARRYAARWNRPTTLSCADDTETLPHPATSARARARRAFQPSVRVQAPVAGQHGGSAAAR